MRASPRSQRDDDHGHHLLRLVAVDGVVVEADPSTNHLLLDVAGEVIDLALVTPAVIELNDRPASLADAKVADHAVATGVSDPAGGLVTYVVCLTR